MQGDSTFYKLPGMNLLKGRCIKYGATILKIKSL